MIEFWPLQSVRFGSSGVRSLQYSEMAAIKAEGDTQIRILDFPNLTSASAHSPDAKNIRKASLPQAAIGSEADALILI